MAGARGPTSADLRALLRLSHALHISTDGSARKELLVSQLAQLVRAGCAVSVVTQVDLRSGRQTPVSIVRHGQGRLQYPNERLFSRCLRAVDRSWATARRVRDDQTGIVWRHAGWIPARAAATHLVHCLWCDPPDCQARIVTCLCVERAPDVRQPFTGRERALLHIAHTEASWIYQGDVLLATRGGMSVSPRQRQVLDYLLAGHGEKQIADKLRLSPNTVHHHIKALHRHFGVSTRSELLAKWVK